MADTPAWFNEEHYLASKAEQLNSIEYEERTDWTAEDVAAAFADAELTAYDHFVQAGNNENVSPNPYFDAQFYLEQKAAQLNADNYQGHTDWNAENVLAAFQAAGVTAWDHFQQVGWAEGISPSADFNVALYLEDKAAQLNDVEHEGRTDWTAEDVKAAFQAAGIDPIAHYEAVGKDEGIEPKTAADAALVELSTRLDTLKAAEAEVDAYVDAAAFEYNDGTDDIEVEAGDATEASIALFYTDMAGQLDPLATGFGDLEADVQDEFISVEKARLQAEVNAAKSGQPANLEALLAAAESARVARVEAVKNAADALVEQNAQIAAFEGYHGGSTSVVVIEDLDTDYDDTADNSGTFFVYQGKIYAGEDGSSAAVPFADLDEAPADLKYGVEVLTAVAATAAADTAAEKAQAAQEKAVVAVYVALNDDATVANLDPAEDFTDVIADAAGEFEVTYTESVSFLTGDPVAPTDYTAGDATDLQVALDDQSNFAVLVAKFQEARALNDGLVELQDARTDAGLALTNPEDDADIPGLDVSLVELAGSDYTLTADDDVVFFSADVGNAQDISAGFSADDLIFFGKGYTFVELGDSVPGTDRLGDVNVLEIFYGVDGGNTVFYVEEDAAAGFDLSGAAITMVTLTGVTDELSITEALGFVGLAA